MGDGFPGHPTGAELDNPIIREEDRDFAIAEIAERIASKKKNLKLPLDIESFIDVYDIQAMIEQCAETAEGHGFWSAHLLNALEKAGVTTEQWTTFCASQEKASTLDLVTFGKCSAIASMCEAEIIGDPYVFLGLIAGEACEAMEAQRGGNWEDADGVWEELADVIIRIFDFVGRFGDQHGLRQSDSGPKSVTAAKRFVNTVQAKMCVNDARPYLHGKSF